MHPRKRWVLNFLIGLAFGIIDWYYLDILAHFPWGNLGTNPIVVPIIIGLNYGIWLVPVLIVTVLENRASHSFIKTALSGAICWVTSILSYYLFYTMLLAFWGLPNMQYLLIFAERQPGFWQEWGIAFQKIILDQVFEWLPIAIISGLFVGGLVSIFSRKNTKPFEVSNTSVS